MEVGDIVQEAVIKTITNKKKRKKEKWLSEEALQIAVKRRDVKGKVEKERPPSTKPGSGSITLCPHPGSMSAGQSAI